MEIKIFAYNGFVGIMSDPDSDGMIAKPGNGNLGCVCDASKVKISQEAIELLKTVPKGADDIGDIDVFKADDNRIIISWFGGYYKVIDPKKSEAARDTNFYLLTPATEEVEVPESFKQFIDSL